MERQTVNNIGAIILDSAMTVHRTLGPGLLESAYQLAMVRELSLRGLNVKAQYQVEWQARSYKRRRICI